MLTRKWWTWDWNPDSDSIAFLSLVMPSLGAAVVLILGLSDICDTVLFFFVPHLSPSYSPLLLMRVVFCSNIILQLKVFIPCSISLRRKLVLNNTEVHAQS